MQQVEIINGAVDFLEVLTSINAARLKKGGEWHGLSIGINVSIYCDTKV